MFVVSKVEGYSVKQDWYSLDDNVGIVLLDLGNLYQSKTILKYAKVNENVLGITNSIFGYNISVFPLELCCLLKYINVRNRLYNEFKFTLVSSVRRPDDFSKYMSSDLIVLCALKNCSYLFLSGDRLVITCEGFTGNSDNSKGYIMMEVQIRDYKEFKTKYLKYLMFRG